MAIVLAHEMTPVTSARHRWWFESTWMDLVGQLANPDRKLSGFLNLPIPEAEGRPRRPVKRVARHRLGDVRDAMIAVLAEAGGPLRTAVIYERVVARLGEPAPTYMHVKDFLSHRSRGDKQLFVREGYGRYRLLGSGETNENEQKP